MAPRRRVDGNRAWTDYLGGEISYGASVQLDFGKAFKWLMVLALVAGLLVAASYIAAWFQAGKYLGPNHPFSGRAIELDYDGVTSLPGNPRAWVVTYHASQLPGVPRAQFVVSLTGDVLAVRPPNLGQLIDAWRAAQQP